MKLKVPAGRIRIPSAGKGTPLGNLLKLLKKTLTAVFGFLSVFLFILSMTHLAAYLIENSSGDVVFVDWSMSVVIPLLISFASLVLYSILNMDRIWGALNRRRKVRVPVRELDLSDLD